MNYWRWLTDSEPFMTRNNCGPGWTNELVAMHEQGNLGIAIAYFLIPVAILLLVVRLVRYRRVPYFWPFGACLAASFIMLCGVCHVLDHLMFSDPMYRLDGLVRSITAVASWLFLAWATAGLAYTRRMRP
jgi:hypothetical protein